MTVVSWIILALRVFFLIFSWSQVFRAQRMRNDDAFWGWLIASLATSGPVIAVLSGLVEQ